MTVQRSRSRRVPFTLLTLIGQRLLAGLLMLLVVSAIIFTGIQLLPGNPASAILGQTATPQAVAALNQQLGLDQPAIGRWFGWLSGVLQGDFGRSFSTREPIGPVLAERLSNSLALAGLTALFAVPLSLLVGFTCARWQGRWPDRLLNLFTRSTVSLPEFFSGYLLIAVFAIGLAWLPSNSSVSSGMSAGDRLLAMALPCLTLTLAVLGHMSNMTRAALVNAQNAAWVDTALLKGLSPGAVLFRHVLPNAWGPIINVMVINLAWLMVGVVIVENVFVYPGLGQYLVDSISKRDMPVIQDCALLLAAIYILLNLLADVVALLANPRLLHGR
ncbi:ABC transporter permease [Pantoea sp. 1.19]|uniref:ABC transporter permease n=1 Tax=Pantoea sp. 1.19 TaxID=1925589 RepID=UPI00094896A9|nr:ABC transporter permease [Pantoea sp. 1.19]